MQSPFTFAPMTMTIRNLSLREAKPLSFCFEDGRPSFLPGCCHQGLGSAGQSLWASAKRPRLVQVAFGAAALVLSNSLAYEFAHLLPTGSGSESPGVCVILAGSVFPAQLRSRRNRCWLGRRPAA